MRNFTVIKSFGRKWNRSIRKSSDHYADCVDDIKGKTIKPGEYICPEIRSNAKTSRKEQPKIQLVGDLLFDCPHLLVVESN